MASRVNVKFVLILSAVLTVVFAGVAGVALYVLSNSGPELEREGDQLMARGEYETAKKVYGKAYNHDRSSIPRLEKYIAAIEAWTPATPTEYSNAYGGDLLSAFHTHAGILRTNVESHERYLEARYQQARWYGQRGVWDGLADATDEAIGYFENNPGVDPSWKRLLRYRGIALVGLMDAADDAGESGSSRNRETDEAEEDLKAALEVNPDDTAAVVELMRFYNIKSRQLANSRRTQDEAAEAAAKAAEVLDTFIATHPTDTVALVNRMFLTYMQADTALEGSLRGLDLIEAREGILATLETPLDRLFELLAQRPTNEIDPLHVDRVATIEQLVSGSTARSAAVVDRVLVDRPNDPAMLDIRASLARRLGEHEKALALYQRIVDMPWPPVSLEGTILLLRQEGAATAMADVALTLWTAAPEGEKAAALERVKAMRAAAGEMVRDTDPRLILLDGKIAFAEQDFSLAQEKLSNYNELSGGKDVVVLAMLADIYLRSNELGSARETVQNLINLQPRNARHYLLLASVENSLGNYEAARLLAQQTVDLDPENEDAINMLAQLEIVANPDAEAGTSPVQAALIRSGLLAMGDGLTAPDIASAIAVLDEAIASLNTSGPQFSSDRESLIVQRIELLSISGDRAGALEQTQQWLQTYPDNDALATLSLRLSAPDTLDGDIQIIDAGADPEHLKLVQKYMAALRRGEKERASQFISQALATAPDDSTVVELAFGEALSREDFDAAKRLADRASAANLDRIHGESFIARFEAARGNVAAAVTTLQQATQSATAPAGAWRLLGQYQSQMGRYSEAIGSFNEALTRSPNDTNAVLALMQTLMLASRNDEALRVARRYEPSASRNSRFVSVWLGLEAEYGDKEVALARREEIQKRLPDNRPNTTALIAMYIDLDRLDEARVLLDRLRGEETDLTVVGLDALLSQKSGDIETAKQVFDQYIASRSTAPGGVRYVDYASYASFLISAGLLDDAIAALETARSVQDPVLKEADAALGRLLFNMNRFEDAAESLQRAVTSGVTSVRIMLAEALLRIGDFSGARQVIEASGENWEEDLEFSLVMMELLNASGDQVGALRLADETVRRFDGSPRPYVERARLKAQDPSLLRDAMDDLTTAIRRDPASWLALSLRAEINSRLGNTDDALQDLRRAVRANPTLDFERQMLIVSFFRSGRVRDAKAIADEAIVARPNDLRLLVSMGDMFAGSGLWDEASGYFAKAWERSPSRSTGMRYIASLIRSTRPSLNDAERVLADPVCDTENSAGMLVLRASLRMKQEKPNIARRDAADAIKLALPNIGLTSRVLEDLNTVFETPRETAEFVLMQDLSALPGRASDHFRAVAMLQIPSREGEALSMLRELAADTSDPIIVGSARQLLVSILLSPEHEAYAEALELMKTGLEQEPDQWTYANNIAYVLSTQLDQLEEALAYAERAREIDPTNAAVLDTLGYVYRRLGRFEEAERSFRLAVANAPDPGMRVSTLLHLGETFVEQGNKAEATKAADEIRSILIALGLDWTKDTDYQELQQQIEGLK